MCNHAKGYALAGDFAEVGDAVEGGVDAGREQRVALLCGIERVSPLPNRCVTGDFSCECTVNWKVLVEETVKFFKGAQRTENTARYKNLQLRLFHPNLVFMHFQRTHPSAPPFLPIVIRKKSIWPYAAFHENRHF